ncbi:M15 family metallopeptidase [Paenibacillus sp. J5C_2022]|uniref:M15 family metallopeptidase n=1 Tax=Paenibacillus sp. J5C2022 TaxID=2977129 RepID=UPI0021D1B42E|nr:M15 family metallopeptidase [Paenibacillus sp. J5C2022]MCU6710728.1 M15 family metallopeptidase [Paenibacillus sp. J5C2022]
MKKGKLLLLTLAIAAVAAGSYALSENTWKEERSGQEEAPRLAEGLDEPAKGQSGLIDESKGTGAVTTPSRTGSKDSESGGNEANGKADESGENSQPDDKPDKTAPAEVPSDSEGQGAANASEQAYSRGEDDEIAVLAEPDSVTALVNPHNKLPEDYNPDDLVYPEVKFIFSEKLEKRKLRKEAAKALEEMFEAAEKDGLYLAGVSGYRSHATQKALFDRYVKRDGYEKARTYSALPGTSEHETGLAIDVSGSDGKCAAADCFGDTKESEWLREHSAEYGFIVRYPEGKDDITGYQYEPWHLRYVGQELAKELADEDLTLEEYYNAVPVSQ